MSIRLHVSRFPSLCRVETESAAEASPYKKLRPGAVFILNCPGGPASLRENYGFKQAQLNAIERELNSITGALCAKWEAIHGQP